MPPWFFDLMGGPLRVPAGGAPAFVPQSSASRPRTAPLSGDCNGYRSMPGRPLLAAFCVAPLSSYAPVRSPLTLRAVSCRRLLSVWQESRPRHSLHSHPDLPEATSAGPARLRGASAGHSVRPARNTTGRPSQASRRPPGTKNGEPRATAPPGHLPPLALVIGQQPFGSCRGHARPAPWTPKACVHSPSSLPPKPPAKEQPNNLGGTRPRQGPSLTGRQSDGGGTRRPGSASMDPSPNPLPTNKREGEPAPQRRVTSKTAYHEQPRNPCGRTS